MPGSAAWRFRGMPGSRADVHWTSRGRPRAIRLRPQHGIQRHRVCVRTSIGRPAVDHARSDCGHSTASSIIGFSCGRPLDVPRSTTRDPTAATARHPASSGLRADVHWTSRVRARCTAGRPMDVHARQGRQVPRVRIHPRHRCPSPLAFERPWDVLRSRTVYRGTSNGRPRATGTAHATWSRAVRGHTHGIDAPARVTSAACEAARVAPPAKRRVWRVWRASIAVR